MNATSTLARIAVLVLATLTIAAAAGCTQPSASMKSSAAIGDPNAQTCGICGGDGDATPVEGAATIEDGTQVCAIGVKEGYLSPNTFTVAAGQPVTLTFEGSAQGCLAKPKVGTKQADFTSGKATLELGTLEPGTYPITCGMDEEYGAIIVQ